MAGQEPLMRNMQKQGIRKTEPLDDELVTAEPSLLRQAINILFNPNVITEPIDCITIDGTPTA